MKQRKLNGNDIKSLEASLITSLRLISKVQCQRLSTTAEAADKNESFMLGLPYNALNPMLPMRGIDQCLPWDALPVVLTPDIGLKCPTTCPALQPD